MQAKMIYDDKIENFVDTFKEFDNYGKTIVILSCDANAYDENIVNELCQQAKSTIIGGVFPQIIFEDKNYDKGVIFAVLDDMLSTTILENISTHQNIEDFIEEHVEIAINQTKTIFVFVDGLSKNIGDIIRGLFDNFGLFANYIGGGAGSLSFVQKPVIFTNKGLLQDCAIIGSSKLNSSIGVKHGWEVISEPIKVTKSIKNVVVELDYKPAFEVYKHFVEADSGLTFDDTNFFDIAKGYPLGVNKLLGDVIVRDPIVMQDNALVCVGDVAENVFVSVLKGKNENLINSVKQANIDATATAYFDSFTLFIDCISRVLFLNEEFTKELEQVYDHTNVTIGALTLGEIANNKNHYLEFYNKTSVVAKIERID